MRLLAQVAYRSKCEMLPLSFFFSYSSLKKYIFAFLIEVYSSLVSTMYGRGGKDYMSTTLEGGGTGR